MREIKFRAWDERKNKYYNGIIAVNEDGVIKFDEERNVWYDTNLIPEQYTGLKDKNGKEIYEGDILSIETSDDYTGDMTEHIDYIKYYKNNLSFGLAKKSEFLFFLFADEYEIIGNIHETPELVYETKDSLCNKGEIIC